MRQASLTIIALALIATGASGGMAFGATRAPSMAISDPSKPVQIPRSRVSVEQLKPSAAFFAQMKQRFSRFRPAWDQNALPLDGNEEALRDTALIDQIYDKEMVNRMRDRYRDSVGNWERVAGNPAMRPTQWQRAQYIESQHDMAKWAVKEIGKDQLRDYIDARLKAGSGVFNVVKDFSGTSLQRQEAEIAKQKNEDKKLSEAERIARVHRRDAVEEEEEEEVPTKLRTRLNLAKVRGALMLQNSIANATVEGGNSGDKLLVEVSREFKKLELLSRARYNVVQSYLAVNVSKRITKEVAVDLSSERWTGEKRSAGGDKAIDSAKVTYSLAF
ncbi:MAG: hypothetical protein EOP11_03195 [Proteobacteria bacterium]|nr:MAG: hypothetical protein EOP11_03195 [Pseudomonadota bacterium]